MMTIDRLRGPDLDIGSRYDSRNARGQKDKTRFGVERDKAESSAEAEAPDPLHDKGSAAKRRPVVRAGRRAGEAHDAHGHDHARRAKETAALDLDWEEPESHAGEDAEDAPEEEDAEDGGAGSSEATADFEVLTSQLLHLGPIREVTLNLPALGVVTARRRGGSVDLSIQVSRGLLEAVRAGLDQMRDQLEAAGLTVGSVEIAVRKESSPDGGLDRDARSAAAVDQQPQWPQRAPESKEDQVLVDIMV